MKNQEPIVLSKQQGAAMNYLLEGKSLKETALLLNVSYSRIINILNEILRKTKIESRTKLLIDGKNINFVVK